MKNELTYRELKNRVEELERKLLVNEELLDKSVDVIWRLDLRLRFTYVSPSIYRAMGFTPEEWIGSKLSSHTSYLEFIKMARIAFSVMKGYRENDYVVFEGVMYHKNGNPIDVEIAGKVLFNKRGLPNRIIGSTRVITERKKIERELARKTQELKESNATKDKFFSIVAHDLRSPFSALIGVSQLLEEEVKNCDNKEIKTYSSLISKTLTTSLDYLNNLLEWSRLQSDKMEFNPIQLQLRNMVKETLDLLQLQSENKHIEIKLSVPEDMTVVADKNMLKTILINLISNAIKYSHPQSEIILVGKSQNGEIAFYVEDYGVGLRPEEQEKIFKIEEMYTTRGTNNESGSGLGLILCKEFIKKHNGEMGVESKFGKGSTFWFKIPVQ